MARIELDLTDVRKILRDVSATIADLDGYQGDVDFDRGRGRHNDPEQARLSRDLLHATEQLRAAATETQTQYWRLKGYPDVRFDEDLASH